jgi:hypothetical protein
VSIQTLTALARKSVPYSLHAYAFSRNATDPGVLLASNVTPVRVQLCRRNSVGFGVFSCVFVTRAFFVFVYICTVELPSRISKSSVFFLLFERKSNCFTVALVMSV